MIDVEHDLWIEKGKVLMANNDDDYYVETFETPEKLDKFIKKMLKIKEECWGKGKK